MKNKTGKLKWIMIIVFSILISMRIVPLELRAEFIPDKKAKETTSSLSNLDFSKIDMSKLEDEPKKAKHSQLHLEPIEKQEETTIHFEPIEKSRQSKWRIIATGLAVITIAIFILCIVIALIRVYKKRYKINSKEKGFLRLTLVLSILAYGIAYICYHNADYYLTRDNAPYLAFGYFVAIWIAYAIIPPVVKWIISGFKKNQ